MASAVGRLLTAAAPRRAAAQTAIRCSSAMVSPAVEFPGTPSVTPDPTKVGTPSVSTLSNGLTVVTESSAATSTLSITYPGAGSSGEEIGESGAALLNKCMNFKAGSGLSSLVILRNLEDEGAAWFTKADRSSATVGFTCAPDKAVTLAPLLATDCAFENWDIAEAKENAKFQIAEAAESAQVTLSEAIYAAAFGAQTVAGRAYYSADASKEAMMAFRGRAYGLKGAVLAATGVSDHASFCSAMEEGYSESPVGEGVPAAAAASFMAGESRVHVPGMGYAHVALALGVPSSSVVGSVAKHCLALMGSASFASSGLVGVYATAPSGEASGMVDTLLSTVSKGPSAAVLKRAKALAKAEAVFAAESGSVAMADTMAKLVAESGSFTSVGAAFDSVSDADVKAVLTGSKPAMAAVGDLSSVPYLASI
eukprot:CAMPEP_0194029298 /NCGR_PEP_ID=MMETSP0009_2-20130614/3060_1 /TAXON_ID=210454 /ORGANISM="Grammatophora oceanica, Strain CCMP 410" /LENGTH=423 /DNA_ID=CAMNT_0038668921 /DNA_START=1575 /DNA_END=2846 /DNA_ORIENTATION=+